MIYLGLGYVLGPGGLGVIRPDPIRYAGTLELVTEGALLISLFAVGLRLGVPMRDRRWILPMRLAFLSMFITVALIAMVGVLGLGLSLGEAVLLGGILAPTDPVLASGIRSEEGVTPDMVRFSLAGEGALNDGSAYPFVLLGIGIMGLHELGTGGWHWWLIDVLWATCGGLGVGALLGGLIGRLVVYLRTRYHSAVGLDEFLSLGLVATSYGLAQLVSASGFLAVFAAGMTLHRVRERPLRRAVSVNIAPDIQEHEHEDFATHSHHASATMAQAVQGFNEQLERLAELATVLVIGAMLPYVTLSSKLWWFIPLVLLLLRPLAVLIGVMGNPILAHQRVMICWFGIRGIGSVFYLAFALHRGLPGPFSQEIITFTLVTVAVSIFIHGVSAVPMMRWYTRNKAVIS
jgi:NhaP-type Na+/H+ or K+/H+ antiporter